MIQIILLYALYAIVFIFSKEALLFSKPIFLTGARMVLAGICSYGLHRFWYKSVNLASITASQGWYIFLLAVFNVYLTNANEAWSLQYLSAGKVSFIYNLSPFFSLFFSRWMFGEPITWKKIAGLIIACVSVTPLLINHTSDNLVDTTPHIGYLSVAEIVMVIAAAATALGWVLMKYLMDQRKDFNSYFLNGISLTLGGLFCFIQVFCGSETAPYVTPGYALNFMWYLTIMMLLQNLVAYNFNAYLLRVHSATLVILFSFVMPIITAILGYFMLEESLTIQFFICSAGVAVGLLIFYQQELVEERKKESSVIAIVLLYALFAASFTIAKILLSFLPPIFLIAVRMTIAGALLLIGYYFFDTDNRKSVPLHKMFWWIGFATIHIAVPYITEFIALQTIAPSCSALIYNLTPFFSALFSYLYFGETMTRKKWFGFGIGFAGIGWFVQSQSMLCLDFNSAYVLILTSVIFGALGWIYVRKLVRQGYSPLMINGIAMLVAGIESFGLSMIFEGSVSLPGSQMQPFLLWLTAIILLTNVIYYNWYAHLLKRYSATLLSFFGCIIPLFTATFDWMLLGIAVDLHFFIGLIIAASGVYIFYQEELRQGYIKK